jgi:hypothetical protein
MGRKESRKSKREIVRKPKKVLGCVWGIGRESGKVISGGE